MPAHAYNADPWAQVDDIDGDAQYRLLELQRSASAADIKAAFRRLAKVHHPDKGGDAVVFGRIQQAFQVLSDPQKRAVYDSWARELQFRYVRGVAAKAPGGEDLLLDEFEGLGLHCEPSTQLVVTCEVCGRPSTKDCWTCGMRICDFCTLKRHWKDNFALHWPLVNSDHMRTRLAKRELEKKRVEDAHRLALEDPNHRNEWQLKEIRAFTAAAVRMAVREDREVAFDLRLARYYMWAQTDYMVFVAVHVPTGFADKELLLDCTDRTFLLQPADSPAIVERSLANRIAAGQALLTHRTEDNRMFCVGLPKAEPCEQWTRIFQGDSDGARCLQQPYTLTETDDDVMMDIELPFWTDASDVRVSITPVAVSIEVRNTLSIHRTYWRNRDEEGKRKDYAFVDVEESLWSLDDEEDASGQAIKLLMITLVKPPLSEDEIMWKKGRRMDNRAADRHGEHGKKGFCFFQEDEDDFGLADILMAMCYKESGSSWVTAKPWDHGTPSKRVTDAAALPPAARKHLDKLRCQADETEAGAGDGLCMAGQGA